MLAPAPVSTPDDEYPLLVSYPVVPSRVSTRPCRSVAPTCCRYRDILMKGHQLKLTARFVSGSSYFDLKH